MSCFLSTSCCGNTGLKEAIDFCHEISPYKIEISAPHHFQLVREYRDLLSTYRNNGFNFILHNYFPAPRHSFVLNIASNIDSNKQQALKLVKNALNLSQCCGSPIYGIHAGYLANATVGDSNGEFKFDQSSLTYAEALDNAVMFVNKIAPLFEKKGISLLIENLFPSMKMRHSLFCSIKEISEFMSQVPKSVGLLLDLGHMNISSNIMEFDKSEFIDSYLDLFGHRLMELHLSENNGIFDEHLAVRKDSWQLHAIKLIKEIPISNNEGRVFCVEARNASISELRESINLVNEIIL